MKSLFIFLTALFMVTSLNAQTTPDIHNGEIAGVWEAYEEDGSITVIDFSPHNYFKVTTNIGTDMGEWLIEDGIITINFWTFEYTMSGTVEEFFANAKYIGPTQHIEVPAGGIPIDVFNNTMNMGLNQVQQMHNNTMEMLDNLDGVDNYDHYIQYNDGTTYGKDW